MESGKVKGCLSNREIMDALADVNISPEQLEKLYDKLEANGIEIVEDSLEDVIEDISYDSGSDDIRKSHAALPRVTRAPRRGSVTLIFVWWSV